MRLKDGRELSSRNDMRGTDFDPMKADDYLGNCKSNAVREVMLRRACAPA